MEFRFRGIDDRTAPYRSSPSQSSQRSSYLSDDQALRGNYSMDPNFLNNPRHFYTIQRQIEKQIIRHEIITQEIITAEIERRRLLEEEVRRELMIEREMAMHRAREMGLSIDDRFSMQLHTRYPLMHQFNNCWLEDRFPFPRNPGLGFGHEPKSDSKICGSKQKAATPPAGSGELPSTSSNKPKEWSCVLCQVSATTERGLDVHLQGKKHKAKEKLLRDLKMCINSTSKQSKESRDSAGQEMKTKVEEESVKASNTVVGLDQKVEGGQALQVKPSSNLCGSNQKAATPPAGSGELPSTSSNKPKEWSCALCQVRATTERGLDGHFQGKKHKAKVAGLLRDKKMCSNSTSSTSKKSTESGDGAGQEMNTKVQEEESVKANKTVGGLNEKVEGGLDEHPLGKKHKAKEEELLGAQKWIKKSTDSAGQEMKAKVEEESVKATKTVVGLDPKVEGEDDSKNKNEELPKKDLNANTQKTTNGIPTGETMKRKLPPRENFEFWCEVCQVGTHSAVVMEDHKRGKKHMARSNKSQKYDEAVPPTTRTTIVTPSEPTEKVEDVDVVTKESNEETADSVFEKAGDEEVVVYRGR